MPRQPKLALDCQHIFAGDTFVALVRPAPNGRLGNAAYFGEADLASSFFKRQLETCLFHSSRI